MSAKKPIEREIGRYLEEVAARLGEMPADEKDDVLRDIESHIYAALEKSGPEPTLDDLNVILAGMDRPSAYARAMEGTGTVAGQARFCRVALAAAASACVLPLLEAVMNSGLDVSPEKSNPLYLLLSFGPTVLGVLSPLAATVLGFVALSRIRASHGRLIGIPLAISIALLYPLIAFIAALALGIGHATRFFAGAERSMAELQNVASAAACVGGVVGVVASILIFRAAWRWAGRAPAVR